jgi:hypothetical protein
MLCTITLLSRASICSYRSAKLMLSASSSSSSANSQVAVFSVSWLKILSHSSECSSSSSFFCFQCCSFLSFLAESIETLLKCSSSFLCLSQLPKSVQFFFPDSLSWLPSCCLHLQHRFLPPLGQMVGIFQFPQSSEDFSDLPLLSAASADPNSPLSHLMRLILSDSLSLMLIPAHLAIWDFPAALLADYEIN